jgi:hypothetical protein
VTTLACGVRGLGAALLAGDTGLLVVGCRGIVTAEFFLCFDAAIRVLDPYLASIFGGREDSEFWREAASKPGKSSPKKAPSFWLVL